MGVNPHDETSEARFSALLDEFEAAALDRFRSMRRDGALVTVGVEEDGLYHLAREALIESYMAMLRGSSR